jgi:hypothetical protein
VRRPVSPARTAAAETRGGPAAATSAAADGPLPRQPLVAGDLAGQTELGVAGQHQPGPPVGLLGMPGPWRGPAERLLGEPDGVLQVEPADVRAPGQVQIQRAALRAGPPQPQHLRRTGAGRHPLDLDAEDGAAHDRPWPTAAVAGVAVLLGMQPAQACTVTVPYWPSLVVWLVVGVGQVVGSAKANLAPWRRGRPPVPGGRGGGSASKQRSDRSRTSTATGASARSRVSCAES